MIPKPYVPTTYSGVHGVYSPKLKCQVFKFRINPHGVKAFCSRVCYDRVEVCAHDRDVAAIRLYQESQIKQFPKLNFPELAKQKQIRMKIYDPEFESFNFVQNSPLTNGEKLTSGASEDGEYFKTKEWIAADEAFRMQQHTYAARRAESREKSRRYREKHRHYKGVETLPGGRYFFRVADYISPNYLFVADCAHDRDVACILLMRDGFTIADFVPNFKKLLNATKLNFKILDPKFDSHDFSATLLT